MWNGSVGGGASHLWSDALEEPPSHGVAGGSVTSHSGFSSRVADGRSRSLTPELAGGRRRQRSCSNLRIRRPDGIDANLGGRCQGRRTRDRSRNIQIRQSEIVVGSVLDVTAGKVLR